MTKVFNKFKKPYFRGKSIFSKNPVLWRISYGPITPCNVLDKTYEPISRKLPERTERRNLCHRTFLVTAEGPKIGCVKRCLSLSHLLKYFLVNTPITKSLLSPETCQKLWLLDYSSYWVLFWVLFHSKLAWPCTSVSCYTKTDQSQMNPV